MYNFSLNMVPYYYLYHILLVTRAFLPFMSIRTTTEDFLFRWYRIIGREIIAHSRNPRPASWPFITGDGFRKLADHIFDATSTTLNPTDVKLGDIVFVGNSLIESFLETIHPHISGTYILITHNGDAVVDQTLFEKAHDKIIAWYGINVVYAHPKIIPIPLGIENQHYFVCGIPAVFNWVQKRIPVKKNKIFYGFTVSTNAPERQAALNVIHTHPEAETLNSWRNFFTYLLELAHYKFVLSPPGSSVEGHRTWDTLYIGGVPIVKSSITTDYFKSIGVPLLVVHDWHEVNTLTKDTLSSVFTDIQNKSNSDCLTFQYWKEHIVSSQRTASTT